MSPQRPVTGPLRRRRTARRLCCHEAGGATDVSHRTRRRKNLSRGGASGRGRALAAVESDENSAGPASDFHIFATRTGTIDATPEGRTSPRSPAAPSIPPTPSPHRDIRRHARLFAGCTLTNPSLFHNGDVGLGRARLPGRAGGRAIIPFLNNMLPAIRPLCI